MLPLPLPTSTREPAFSLDASGLPAPFRRLPASSRRRCVAGYRRVREQLGTRETPNAAARLRGFLA